MFCILGLNYSCFLLKILIHVPFGPFQGPYPPTNLHLNPLNYPKFIPMLASTYLPFSHNQWGRVKPSTSNLFLGGDEMLLSLYEKLQSATNRFRVYGLVTYLDENFKHIGRLLDFDTSMPAPKRTSWLLIP